MKYYNLPRYWLIDYVWCFFCFLESIISLWSWWIGDDHHSFLILSISFQHIYPFISFLFISIPEWYHLKIISDIISFLFISDSWIGNPDPKPYDEMEDLTGPWCTRIIDGGMLELNTEKIENHLGVGIYIYIYICIYCLAITRRGRLNLALRGCICWSEQSLEWIQVFESSMMIEQHFNK